MLVTEKMQQREKSKRESHMQIFDEIPPLVKEELG